MQTLEQRRVLITGGSRGLGLGVVEAFVARRANVIVIARDSARLTEIKARLGVSIIPGDATDPMLAESVLREVRPSSRVLISSSGAAIEGSPLSGGYAGAKRMMWLMAGYANGVANDLNLGIRFQALLLRQIVGTTELGRAAAEAYARRKGVGTEAFLAGFGKPLSPRDYGEHVATLLTDPRYESATAFGIRGETGIQPLDA